MTVEQRGASLGKVIGYFVGHLVGITFLFGFIAGVAAVLDLYVKKIEPLGVRIPYFIPILESVEATLFYVDVLLFIVGVLAAAVLFIKELRKCF
jgi:hypothetical protein